MIKITEDEYNAIYENSLYLVDCDNHPEVVNDGYTYVNTHIIYFQKMFMLLHSRILKSKPGGENMEYFKDYSENIQKYASIQKLLSSLVQNIQWKEDYRTKLEKIEKVLKQ